MKPFQIVTYCLFILVLSTFSCQIKGYKKIQEKWGNGQLKSSGWQKNGLKTGQWKHYSSTGWLESREKWAKGNWQWSIFYNEKHQKTAWKNAKGEEKQFNSCGCNR